MSRVQASMLPRTVVLSRESKGVPGSTTGPFVPVVYWLKINTPYFCCYLFTQTFKIKLIKRKKNWEIFAPKTEKV